LFLRNWKFLRTNWRYYKLYLHPKPLTVEGATSESKRRRSAEPLVNVNGENKLNWRFNIKRKKISFFPLNFVFFTISTYSEPSITTSINPLKKVTFDRSLPDKVPQPRVLISSFVMIVRSYIYKVFFFQVYNYSFHICDFYFILFIITLI